MTINIDSINPNNLVFSGWNSNVVSPDNDTKLENSLTKYGMFKPIVVRTLKTGELQVIGGEHRAQAAIRLGMQSVPIVNLGVISDKKAKEISLVDNSRSGSDNNFKLAEILKDIGGVQEISDVLPTEINDLELIFSSASLALDELDRVELPLDDIELPKAKTIVTHQIMRFKVPVADVDTITNLIESTIRTQGFDEADSLTNAGDALVHLLSGSKEHD